jgi:hypothetical protein
LLWVRIAGVTSSGPSSRLLLLLVVSAACGGKSRVIPADTAPGSCVTETLMSEPTKDGAVSVDITCDFPIPVPPGAAAIDPDSVTMTLAVDGGTPELLPHLVECDDTDGFTIAGDPGRVVLCPATCAVLSTALMPTMTIEACAKP